MEGFLRIVECRKKRGEKRALLVLEDGSVFKGIGFGAVKKVYGEVVFNTGMVGYVESITDPSYNGQILVQTYPLVGNYGVCPDHFESDGPKIEGYVIRELCREPSHWASRKTLEKWLEEEGIPGICGIDTRYLTQKLRTHGTMLGILYVYEGDEPNIDGLLSEVKNIPDPNKTDLVIEVATKEVLEFTASPQPAFHVVLIDCGAKRGIIRELLKRNIRVTVVPPTFTADKILDYDPDGILISNGPGDPKMVPYIVETARSLCEYRIPMMGICLGNQIIALALGGDTYKLKFGHRGQNHPCIDLATNRCYITSQNHGYVVDIESLKKTGVEITHINANDKTVEGIKCEDKPIFAVQFHPEASPGPEDNSYLFDNFVKLMRRYRA